MRKWCSAKTKRLFGSVWRKWYFVYRTVSGRFRNGILTKFWSTLCKFVNIRKFSFFESSIKKTFRFACVHVASVASRAVLVKRWTVVLMLIQHLLPFKARVENLFASNFTVIRFLTHIKLNNQTWPLHYPSQYTYSKATSLRLSLVYGVWSKNLVIWRKITATKTVSSPSNLPMTAMISSVTWGNLNTRSVLNVNPGDNPQIESITSSRYWPAIIWILRG